MRKIIMIAMALLAVNVLMAQHYTVKGVIADAKTGEKIPLANAGLYRLSDTMFMRGTTTDFEGNFSISDVAAGSYRLIVSVVGYEKYYQEVNIAKNTDLGAIKLKVGITLAEVKIVAEKPVFSMDGEKNIYNTGDDPSIQTGTASDALQNAPGIEIDADGNITLRGTQSVDVWINDRPSHMEGEALKQYIKMLPANSIERIEVISNPSARYGGGTPVVNIITTQKIQRNEFISFGLNGTTRPDQHIWMSEMKPWVSYVYANEKFNFNIYANFGYDRSNSEYEGTSIILDDNKDTSRTNKYFSTSDRKSMESYIGGHLSYNMDENNSMGAWYGAYPRWGSNYEWGRSERIEYLGENAGNHTYEGIENTPMVAKPNGGGYFGGWYEHKFNKETGHKLNLNVNGNGYNSHNNTYHDRHYEFFPENDIVRNVDNLWRNFSLGTSADYTLPFGHQDTTTKRFANELQAGLGYDHGSNRNWSISDWESEGYLMGRTDSIGSNQRSNNNNLTAYVTYQRRFGNFTAKLGLRGNMNMEGIEYFDAPQYNIDSTFFSLTPSLHLSYSTKSLHNFSFSYSRRVYQPGVSQLTLYKEYNFDDFGSWGNPDLLPTYSQKVELQWDKYFMKFGSVGAQLFYSGNTNTISDLANVTYSDFYGNVVSYTIPMNIGNSWSTGLDLNVTYRPSAYINVRFSGSLRYDNEDFTFRGQNFENSNWSYRFRLNAWAKVWKNYQFFVNAHYGSPTKSIFTITDARKGVDVGMNADFWNRKMSVDINVHDIFRLNGWNSQNENPFYVSTSNWRPLSRYISVRLTFRFGKMELAGMANEGAASSGSGESGMGMQK